MELIPTELNLTLILPNTCHSSSKEEEIIDSSRKIMIFQSLPLHQLHFCNPNFEVLVRTSPLSQLRFKKVIGKGDGGTVYQIESNFCKSTYALKILGQESSLGCSDRFGLDGIRSEISLAKKLQHPHIVTFLAVFSHSAQEYIITKFYEAGVSILTST